MARLFAVSLLYDRLNKTVCTFRASNWHFQCLAGELILRGIYSFKYDYQIAL